MQYIVLDTVNLHGSSTEWYVLEISENQLKPKPHIRIPVSQILDIE